MKYIKCPKCGNSHSTLYIEETEVEGMKFEGIFCPSCEEFIYLYPKFDYEDRISDLESKIDDLEKDLELLKRR